MRIAFFSPLPPSKSGIADYSSELLPYLSRGAEITVFVEQASEAQANRQEAEAAGYRVAEISQFTSLDADRRFDLCLYHQGNNPYHRYIYEQALARPGLLILHEHCLHHLIAWKTLGSDDWDAYWDEMFFAYGRRGSQIAGMRERDIGSEYQQFLMPLNRRLAAQSLGLIVHNQYAASQIERLDLAGLPRAPVEIIPHHLSPKIYKLDGWEKIECRHALGLPDEAFIIASLGFVTQSKRIPQQLSAFKKLLALVDAYYLVVGEDHWKWSVAPLVERMGLGERVRITGYTSERDFFRYLKAVDVIVNLRYPTAGETSGTLIRALGAGKPVIVSDHGQFGELPEEICLKAAPGGAEEEQEIFSQLRKLAYRPELRDSIGERAARWAREECAIERSAARYLAFAEQIITAERKRPASVRRFPLAGEERDAKPPRIRLDREEALSYVAAFFRHDPAATGYLGIHGERIVRTVELIPVGGADKKLLELSSYLQMTPLIKRDGRYGEIEITNWWEGEPRVKWQSVRHAETGEEIAFPMRNLDVERERFPYPDEHFDVALCCELVEHLTEDPMQMMSELNRVLKWGALLILTTPNIASAFSIGEALAGSSPYIYGSYNRQSRADRHSREYTPKDVQLLFEAAGFKVIELFTENLWHRTDEEMLAWLDRTGVPRHLRGDNIFAVGRKSSYQIERYPERIYD